MPDRTPEQRAAEVLPCWCDGWDKYRFGDKHRPGCPQRESGKAVAQAIREAENKAHRRGYEAAIRFYCLGINPNVPHPEHPEQQEPSR